MPVRSYRPYTRSAVDSILAQTHAEFELIIVGHKDIERTLDQLPKDSRIRGVVRSGPGIVCALNSGLDIASGEFIARMDDDDIAYPHRLATQLSYANSQQDHGLYGARVQFFNEDNQIGLGNLRYQNWLNGLKTSKNIRDACFIESPLPHPTLFAHKYVWSRLGGYRNGDWPEDYDLILRAWLTGISMGKPDETLLRWREHPDRLTYSDKRYRRQAFTDLKAQTLVNQRAGFGLDQNRGIWICGTGRNARYWCDCLISLDANVIGFVDLDRPQAKKSKRHRPVITYSNLMKARKDALIISAISDPTARTKLRVWLTKQGLIVNQDFIIGG